MKLKWIIIFGLAVFVLISQVGAADNVSYYDNNTTITFEEIEFTIPEGFGEYKSHEDYDDLGSEGKTCFYINEAQGKIIITVISDWMGMSLDELKQPDAVKSKVNGYSGWNYTKDDLHHFAFIKEDKGVIVAVTNETRLAQVIV